MATVASDTPRLADQLGRLRERTVSSADLVERALERIEATQGTVNAFRIVRAAEARAEAAEADRRLERGARAPLLGVPVAIKDDMDLGGAPTAFGCAGEFEPKADDGEVARRLKEAGAVIVGKTNSPEFGQWPMTEGAHGATRNPWSLEHTPGGSSGGSAAAVAAGILAAAVGSDGAGSVRIPAAWCGLVGLKPQRNRISTRPYDDAFNGLTCYGPLAHTVEDAALLLDVLAAADRTDPGAPAPPPEPFAEAARREPGRLRIAVSLRAPFSAAPIRLHPEIRQGVVRLADRLADLGHEVFRADPRYGLVGVNFLPRSTAGVAEWADRVPDPSALDARTRANAKLGRLLGGPVVALARRLEGPLRAQVGRIFRRADVVLTPTTAQPPLPVGALDGLSEWQTGQRMTSACPYTYAWNVLGWPALNVPAGRTEEEGLPFGAQLLGRECDEATLLALGRQAMEAGAVA